MRGILLMQDRLKGCASAVLTEFKKGLTQIHAVITELLIDTKF